MCRSPSSGQWKQSSVVSSHHIFSIIVLHYQQGEKHHARCAFPRLMLVHISTDIRLNMSLTVLLQLRLHRYAQRLLVGNTYFPLVTVCLAHMAKDNYVVAINLCSLLCKEFFCKMKFKVQYSYEKITSLFNFRIVTLTYHCCLQYVHNNFDILQQLSLLFHLV